MRQDRPRPGVRGNVGQPIRREARVQRDVGGVRLEHGQHAEVAIERLVEEQGNPVAGPHALPGDQEPGELIGPRVEASQ